MNREALTAINKWFYFSMNYPYGFIEKIWGDEPWLANHIKSKFDHLYDVYGSYGVINALYGELDTTNRVKFMNWVMNNYNNEIAIKFADNE